MKEKFTRKLYHKKFTHRAYFKTSLSVTTKEAGPTPDVIKWFMVNQQVAFKTQVSTVNEGWSGHYWNTRYSHYMTVYFSDETMVDKLKEAFGDSLVELERPRDAKHLQVLETERVLTRKTLFYKKYRVVCRSNHKYKDGYNYSTEHFEEMKAWCKSHLTDEDWKYHCPWSSASFFFKDRKTAMMFKLAWSDNIKTTERIILLDEIDEDDADD